MGKKLKAIAKIRDCEKVKKWLPIIRNHICWIAASSTSGPEKIAKWNSVLNHLQDIHTHDDPKCQHEIRVPRDKDKWLKAGEYSSYMIHILVAIKNEPE